MNLSPMPKGAPMVDTKAGTVSEDWSIYLTKLTDIVREMTRPQQVETSGQFCTVVRIGSVAFWWYTGIGGVTFQFQGASIVIPVSTTSQEVTGQVIIGGDNAR